MAVDVHQLSRRYAKAFFVTLKGNGKTSFGFYQDALEALSVISDDELATFFQSPLFETEEKNKVLQNIFDQHGIEKETQNFVRALNQNRHVHLLKNIHHYFVDHVLEERNDIKAQIKTAFALSIDEENRIKAVLSKMFNKNINTEQTIDPSLIGGICVDVGGMVYDASIAGYFDRMEKTMTHKARSLA